MTQTKLPFPSVLDSTMLSAYTVCPQYFFRSYINRLRLKSISSIHLHTGGALASALCEARLAFYQHGDSREVAEAKGLAKLWKEYGTPQTDEYTTKTWDRVTAAYEYYLDQFPLGKDLAPVDLSGKPAVECSFSIPIEGISHPQTGDPIIIAGRYDMLGMLPNGSLWCVDEKTTSRMGSRWAEQWDLRAQFRCYQWAARQHGFAVDGLLVRGICILKNEIRHGEKYVYWREWCEDRWLFEIQDRLRRMISDWERGYWPYALGDACQAFSGCPFRTLCESPQPDNWLHMYETNDWDPLRISVEENGV